MDRQAAGGTREIRDIAFRSRKPVFEFLLDHPDFAADVAGVRREGKYRVRRVGDAWKADDGHGARGLLRFVSAEDGRRLFYLEGRHDPALLPSLTGRLVLLLDADHLEGPDGITYCEMRVAGYLRLDSAAAEVLAFVARSFSEAQVDKKVRRFFRHVAVVSRTSHGRIWRWPSPPSSRGGRVMPWPSSSGSPSGSAAALSTTSSAATRPSSSDGSTMRSELPRRPVSRRRRPRRTSCSGRSARRGYDEEAGELFRRATELDAGRAYDDPEGLADELARRPELPAERGARFRELLLAHLPPAWSETLRFRLIEPVPSPPARSDAGPRLHQE